MLSVYERKSRLGKLFKLTDRSSLETARGLVTVLKSFKVHTVTYDNGGEFAMHRFVNDSLGAESYFCKPYSSWEKGGVENFNGLVRQYFPKGTDLSIHSQDDLDQAAYSLNTRPRQTLGGMTPSDKLAEAMQ